MTLKKSCRRTRARARARRAAWLKRPPVQPKPRVVRPAACWPDIDRDAVRAVAAGTRR